MKSMKVTTDDEGMGLMVAAAAYRQIPVTIWARSVLLDEARSVVHKKKCESPAEKKYMWLGKPCTREVYEAKQK